MTTDRISLAQALTADRRLHEQAVPQGDIVPGLGELSGRLRLAIGAEPLRAPEKPREPLRRRPF